MNRVSHISASQASPLFELLVRNVLDYAIFAADKEGFVLTWNEGARRMMGYRDDEIVGQHISRLVVSEDRHSDAAMSELESARKHSRYEAESWRVRQDGSRFWANTVITPLQDKGQLIGYGVIIRDLSERKHAAERLRRTEEVFQMLVSAVKDYAIFLLDPQGNVVTWNEGAQRIKGYSEDEIVGKHFSNFYPEEAKAINHPQNELELAVKNGHYEEEGWRVRKDGSRFWASVVITPVRDEGGHLRGFVKVTRDLSEKKRVQEAIEQARDEAIRASRLKSEFVANVSHEIRTPMAGIIGMAEQLILDETLTPDQREIAEHVFNSSKRLLDVLNDLLDFSKLEAGRVTYDESAFSLRRMMEEVYESVLPPAQKKGLRIITEIYQRIPEQVLADEQKIRQTLMNFAHNAVKFTREGTVTIKCEIVGSDNGTFNARFAVVDTGIGISPEAKAQLFQPFVQADGSTRRRFGGTGLGLSIAKRYVELMGGTVGFDSEPGKGSTFWFEIPLKAK